MSAFDFLQGLRPTDSLAGILRQIQLQGITGADDDGVFDNIPQFADVSRP